ncbi:hypothetical protein ONZ43_g4507 [Nemania bipapillata]|uniref:Uncharacterized protein n=1 Tax=Nemania bipapillata TaxID=110536 RepID=A0ACC2ILP5_9PEZI|nr:hypothetical protein ONZ43_g4507 [Nemania bipapillata]
MSPKKAPSQKGPSAKERAVETQDSQDKAVAALITEQAREALSVIFAVRFVNSLCVRTFFQPDEYFQVLEPAWQMMYGNSSGAWLTWVRYFLVDSFWATYNVPMVKAKWLLMAPKAMQTGFAALSDWYTWRLAEKLYGPSSAAAWSVPEVISSTSSFCGAFETYKHLLESHPWIGEFYQFCSEKFCSAGRLP